MTLRVIRLFAPEYGRLYQRLREATGDCPTWDRRCGRVADLANPSKQVWGAGSALASVVVRALPATMRIGEGRRPALVLGRPPGALECCGEAGQAALGEEGPASRCGLRLLAQSNLRQYAMPMAATRLSTRIIGLGAQPWAARRARRRWASRASMPVPMAASVEGSGMSLMEISSSSTKGGSPLGVPRA